MVAYLYRRHYRPVGRALRACHPRDLLDQIIALCRYRGIEPAVTRELLDAACASYFVDGCGTASSSSVTHDGSRSRSDLRPMEVH